MGESVPRGRRDKMVRSVLVLVFLAGIATPAPLEVPIEKTALEEVGLKVSVEEATPVDESQGTANSKDISEKLDDVVQEKTEDVKSILKEALKDAKEVIKTASSIEPTSPTDEAVSEIAADVEETDAKISSGVTKENPIVDDVIDMDENIKPEIIEPIVEDSQVLNIDDILSTVDVSENVIPTSSKDSKILEKENIDEEALDLALNAGEEIVKELELLEDEARIDNNAQTVEGETENGKPILVDYIPENPPSIKVTEETPEDYNTPVGDALDGGLLIEEDPNIDYAFPNVVEEEPIITDYPTDTTDEIIVGVSKNALPEPIAEISPDPEAFDTPLVLDGSIPEVITNGPTVEMGEPIDDESIIPQAVYEGNSPFITPSTELEKDSPAFDSNDMNLKTPSIIIFSLRAPISNEGMDTTYDRIPPRSFLDLIRMIRNRIMLLSKSRMSTPFPEPSPFAESSPIEEPSPLAEPNYYPRIPYDNRYMDEYPMNQPIEPIASHINTMEPPVIIREEPTFLHTEEQAHMNPFSKFNELRSRINQIREAAFRQRQRFERNAPYSYYPYYNDYHYSDYQS